MIHKKAWKTRTQVFHWETKQKLYSYFEEKHGLTDERIDAEVARALRTFKLRESESIRTEELWEKVGRSLARHVGDTEILAEVEPERSGHGVPPQPDVKPETRS